MPTMLRSNIIAQPHSIRSRPGQPRNGETLRCAPSASLGSDLFSLEQVGRDCVKAEAADYDQGDRVVVGE